MCLVRQMRHRMVAHFFKVVDFFDAVVVVGDAKAVVGKLREASVAEHTTHLGKLSKSVLSHVCRSLERPY